MIWKMIWDVWTASGVVLNDNENEKNVGTSCIIVCLCIGGYPLPFTIVRKRTLRGRNTIIMVIIMLQWPSRKTIIIFIIMLRRSGRGTIIMVNLMLQWRLLVLTGVWPKELLEYARLTRKVAQRCANWPVVTVGIRALGYRSCRLAYDVCLTCSMVPPSIRKWNVVDCLCCYCLVIIKYNS